MFTLFRRHPARSLVPPYRTLPGCLPVHWRAGHEYLHPHGVALGGLQGLLLALDSMGEVLPEGAIMDGELVILVDSREQCPLSFPAGIKTIPATLATGDYSMPGFEDHCAIERKELGDLLNCIGPERDRFKRELLRLRSYACRAVVVESDLQTIMAGGYRSKVHPSAVIGSIASWMTRYHVPFIFAGDRAGAASVVLAMLRTYRRQIAEFITALDGEGGGPV